LALFSGKSGKLVQDSIHYLDREGGSPTDKAALKTKRMEKYKVTIWGNMDVRKNANQTWHCERGCLLLC
jgi:hypothetical protein